MKYGIFILIVFGLLQWRISSRPPYHEEKKIFIPPSKNISLYSFGHEDMVSSLMWVRVLQDMHLCDQNPEKVPYPGYEKGEDVLEQILTRKLPISRCDQGWVYQMLDVITDLTPDFRLAYADGATMLSVLVDDRKGAQKLFHKSLEYFPEDWELLYRTAYHELFEMQNPKEAAVLLKRAGERGAPKWVYALSAKLYTKMGQATFAKTILESVLEKRKHDRNPQINRVRMQLEKVNEYLENANK